MIEVSHKTAAFSQENIKRESKQSQCSYRAVRINRKIIIGESFSYDDVCSTVETFKVLPHHTLLHFLNFPIFTSTTNLFMTSFSLFVCFFQSSQKHPCK